MSVEAVTGCTCGVGAAAGALRGSQFPDEASLTVASVRVVMATAEELAALLRSTVEETLAAHERAEQAPVLLDRAELARKLGCSASHVDTLRAEGQHPLFGSVSLHGSNSSRASPGSGNESGEHYGCGIRWTR